MNLLDRAIAVISPSAALQRAQARRILAAYEGAQQTRKNKLRRAIGSPNNEVLQAGQNLRQMARHLEQNHDLALGVINTLVSNIVGPHGIGIEPQPRKADGTIDDVLARKILDLWKDWVTAPEVTRQHDWASAQRIMCRSWLRDGEVFAQTIVGNSAFLNHGTTVPFSIEMLEADYVPMDYNTLAPTPQAGQITQGIEHNAWGMPTAYHVYKNNPLEGSSGGIVGGSDTKRIPAASMLHLKNVHRIRQARGVSVFASVLTRFDDLKDYEESERIAAKIAASMAAYIKKGSPDTYDPDQSGEDRMMKMAPGMIFDDLLPGEDIGTIDTNRPNTNLLAYRNGQLKAIAAGTGPTFSSIAKTYDGTYSAQRQELVEGYAMYSTMANEFISRIVRPIYERFIAAAVAAGLLGNVRGIDAATLDDAAYLPLSMPWIDPQKEAEAWGMMEDRCYVSGPEVIRKRGGNPIDTLEQQARWLREKDGNGVPHNAAMPEPAPQPDQQEAQQ